MRLATLLIIIIFTAMNASSRQPGSPGEGSAPEEITLNPATADTAGIGAMFAHYALSEGVLARMRGRSLPANCPVDTRKLRYLVVPHWGIDSMIHIGEMVANVAIADELLDIFRELFGRRYPIERMRLIDDYDGDDQASMMANNTSCFNYRRISGLRKLSRHATGMAVDINPRYNPYMRRDGRIEPAGSEPYADRTRSFPMKITKSDPACKAFRSRGFRWGGSWRNRKDYQHFQK